MEPLILYIKMQFKIESEFKPTGDQPKAIKNLVSGLKSNEKFQTLMGNWFR